MARSMAWRKLALSRYEKSEGGDFLENRSLLSQLTMAFLWTLFARLPRENVGSTSDDPGGGVKHDRHRHYQLPPERVLAEPEQPSSIHREARHPWIHCSCHHPGMVHRRQGHFKRFIESVCDQYRDRLVVVEAVQSPILAAALVRWDYDPDVMDFYYRGTAGITP